MIILELLKILVTGIAILIGAIFMNFLAKKFSIATWYEFLEDVKFDGFSRAIKFQRNISLVFMFIIYPLLLGLIAWLILEVLL
ncbi:hypothetical protein K9L16_03435 [Candidatus Pacearchaeota archaeon]|nr:hypothetical protein [Candidatus Pacearchaeota archaeon]